MAIAKHKKKLKLCLNADDKGHVVTGKCPLHPLVVVLEVEDKKGVLSYAYLHVFRVIVVLHVQIFVDDPNYVL